MGIEVGYIWVQIQLYPDSMTCALGKTSLNFSFVLCRMEIMVVIFLRGHCKKLNKIM